MSLQQALRSRIPSVDRVEKLRKIVSENRWSVRHNYLSPNISIAVQCEKLPKIHDARQAFFTAQDELTRLLGKG